MCIIFVRCSLVRGWGSGEGERGRIARGEGGPPYLVDYHRVDCISCGERHVYHHEHVKFDVCYNFLKKFLKKHQSYKIAYRGQQTAYPHTHPTHTRGCYTGICGY